MKMGNLPIQSYYLENKCATNYNTMKQTDSSFEGSISLLNPLLKSLQWSLYIP